MANKFNKLPKKNVAGRNYVSQLTRLYAVFLNDERSAYRSFTVGGTSIEKFEFQDVTSSDSYTASNPTTIRKSITGGTIDKSNTGVEVSLTVNASRNFIDFLNNLAQLIGGVDYKNLNGELAELWIIKEESKPVGYDSTGKQLYEINSTAFVNCSVESISGGSEEGGTFSTGSYQFKADEKIANFSGDLAAPYGSYEKLLVGSGLPTVTSEDIKNA